MGLIYFLILLKNKKLFKLIRRGRDLNSRGHSPVDFKSTPLTTQAPRHYYQLLLLRKLNTKIIFLTHKKLKMKCIICGGSEFSMPPFAHNLPSEEQIKYTKYGDCCCFSCALARTDILIQQNGSKQVIIEGEKETYRILIPNVGSKEYKEIICEVRL